MMLMIICIIGMMIFMVLNNRNQEYIDSIERMLANVSNSSVCVIPWFSLVKKDLEHRKAFQRVRPLQCKKIQPELTFYKDGMFRWNRTLLQMLDVSLVCSASFVVRKRANDNELAYSEEFAVEPGVDRKLGGSLINIKCFSEVNGLRKELFYNALHQNVFIKKNVPRRHSRPNTEKKPTSVFILMIESLSRVNAHIQLPKTLSVLESKMNATFLNGKTDSDYLAVNKI